MHHKQHQATNMHPREENQPPIFCSYAGCPATNSVVNPWCSVGNICNIVATRRRRPCVIRNVNDLYSAPLQIYIITALPSI